MIFEKKMWIWKKCEFWKNCESKKLRINICEFLKSVCILKKNVNFEKNCEFWKKIVKFEKCEF